MLVDRVSCALSFFKNSAIRASRGHECGGDSDPWSSVAKDRRDNKYQLRRTLLISTARATPYSSLQKYNKHSKHILSKMQRIPRRFLSTAKFARFNWADPLNLESSLTDEERAVRDSSASYCQTKLAPRVQDAFRNEST
jgi:hypothetical protein